MRSHSLLRAGPQCLVLLARRPRPSPTSPASFTTWLWTYAIATGPSCTTCADLRFPGIEGGLISGRTVLAFVQPAKGRLDRRSGLSSRERMTREACCPLRCKTGARACARSLLITPAIMTALPRASTARPLGSPGPDGQISISNAVLARIHSACPAFSRLACHSMVVGSAAIASMVRP